MTIITNVGIAILSQNASVSKFFTIFLAYIVHHFLEVYQSPVINKSSTAAWIGIRIFPRVVLALVGVWHLPYRVPLHEECSQHHGHKGDPGVTPESCGAIGERDQVILVWVRALGIWNASQPQGLRVMRARP